MEGGLSAGREGTPPQEEGTHEPYPDTPGDHGKPHLRLGTEPLITHGGERWIGFWQSIGGSRMRPPFRGRPLINLSRRGNGSGLVGLGGQDLGSGLCSFTDSQSQRRKGSRLAPCFQPCRLGLIYWDPTSQRLAAGCKTAGSESPTGNRGSSSRNQGASNCAKGMPAFPARPCSIHLLSSRAIDSQESRENNVLLSTTILQDFPVAKRMASARVTRPSAAGCTSSRPSACERDSWAPYRQ